MISPLSCAACHHFHKVDASNTGRSPNYAAIHPSCPIDHYRHLRDAAVSKTLEKTKDVSHFVFQDILNSPLFQGSAVFLAMNLVGRYVINVDSSYLFPFSVLMGVIFTKISLNR